MRLARPLACHANLRAPDSRVLIASREQARSGAWSRRAQYNHGANHVQGRSAASRLAFPCCRTARSDRRDGGGGGAAQEAARAPLPSPADGLGEQDDIVRGFVTDPVPQSAVAGLVVIARGQHPEAGYAVQRRDRPAAATIFGTLSIDAVA